MENFGDPDNITRESVTAAMNAATDVDTFGLIPPWTPNKPSDSRRGRVQPDLATPGTTT